ncbi:GNAT family N-acetyltransferase [Maridesulfovibrio sp.]|uniref:GNAT family N-acetyltransferase n=1 Tax=Maridesulfovibrio sp. TaxID=2795000 RepID=UPI002A18AA77|nr:GNAT family N-acetyltransferase [Maridesulfovibrio sp.]
MTDITIRQLESISTSRLNELCTLLIDTVEGGASVGFLSPIAMDTAKSYWLKVESELESATDLLVAEKNGQTVGSVQIVYCTKENGAHRGEVQKLFVLQSNRRHGVATRLMLEAEKRAAQKGKTLLTLDTQENSSAEKLYEKLGWQKAGVIPDYACSPNGKLHGTTLFFKHVY